MTNPNTTAPDTTDSAALRNSESRSPSRVVDRAPTILEKDPEDWTHDDGAFPLSLHPIAGRDAVANVQFTSGYFRLGGGQDRKIESRGRLQLAAGIRSGEILDPPVKRSWRYTLNADRFAAAGANEV